MALPTIAAPSVKCEQAIYNFLSSSLSGSGVNIYTGINNDDKQSPAVIISCTNLTEVIFNTRVYAFEVDIVTREIAYDDTESNFMNIAGNVIAYFADDVSNKTFMGSFTSGIKFWQCQMIAHANAHVEDAWVQSLSIRLIGALVP